MLAAAPVANVEAPVADKNNIINVRDGESLYQICIKLRRRLSGVPGFMPYLEEIEEREADGADPVSSLWQCFRSGLPLLAIYNASQPEEGELTVDMDRPDRVGKQATFLFIKSCVQQMSIPVSDTFTITDLYSDNTTGFVKVTKLVNRVLDLLKMSGKLHTSTDSEASGDVDGPIVAGKPKSRREHILKELVDSERHYVHHLQNLQVMKKELEEVGALPGDSIHNMFLNLNNLLDFAQRFLIRIEQQHELPEAQQNWGQLFIRYKEPFRQYEPFIANQKRCEVTCNQEWEKMCATARSTLTKQMLANPTILNGFLLKPFQRLTKYPLLLRDLEKTTESELLKADLNTAIEIIQDVLHQADASIDKETREEALQDLAERVEDWKNLSLQSMGELLLLGTFIVLKDGALRSEEKEYHIYLFSRILIMCKDVNISKQRKKGLKVMSNRGKPMMHIKGRIYFTNVTQVQPTSAQGNYNLQIQWKGERDGSSVNEVFIIKFKNDDNLQKWYGMIQTQRSASLLERGNSMNASKTHLISMSGIDIENPYANLDDDEDSHRMSSSTHGGLEMSMSRNGSSTSLRARSATGGGGRMGSRPRLPNGEFAKLPALNTQVSAPSPGAFGGQSYFSPVGDSPPQSASTRSSAQSAFQMYQRTVSSNSNSREENYRNTAPAMGRNAHPSGNPYLTNGRAPSRPSLPPGTVQNANSIMRMRSASSPDINPALAARKTPLSESVPNVPPIPGHLSKQMVPPNRSNNNSPGVAIPLRTATPSQQYDSRPTTSHNHRSYESSYRSHNMGHSFSTDRTGSPPLSAPSSEPDSFMPSQLRAKVCFEDNYVCVIIPSNIHFRSLTEKIDAKLGRLTNYTVQSGSVRLRYRDEDGDYILIDSDEAVQDAFLDWKEQNTDRVGPGHIGELQLFATLAGEARG